MALVLLSEGDRRGLGQCCFCRHIDHSTTQGVVVKGLQLRLTHVGLGLQAVIGALISLCTQTSDGVNQYAIRPNFRVIRSFSQTLALNSLTLR